MISDDRAWDRGWEAHDAAQRLRIAKLPLWVKIQWLEDAQRLMEHLALDAGRRPSPPRGDDSKGSSGP